MPLSAFELQRVTLAAATATPVTPPRTCSSCGIANETGGDLLVSTDQAGTQYVTVGDGLLLGIDLSQSGPGVAQFQKGYPSFFLTSAAGGAVALFWL